MLELDFKRANTSANGNKNTRPKSLPEKTNTMGLAYPKICSARERNSLDIVVVFETIYLFIVLLLMQRGTVHFSQCRSGHTP